MAFMYDYVVIRHLASGEVEHTIESYSQPLQTICVPSESSTLIPSTYDPALDTYVASAGAAPCGPGSVTRLYSGKRSTSGSLKPMGTCIECDTLVSAALSRMPSNAAQILIATYANGRREDAARTFEAYSEHAAADCARRGLWSGSWSGMPALARSNPRPTWQGLTTWSWSRTDTGPFQYMSRFFRRM